MMNLWILATYTQTVIKNIKDGQILEIMMIKDYDISICKKNAFKVCESEMLMVEDLFFEKLK